MPAERSREALPLERTRAKENTVQNPKSPEQFIEILRAEILSALDDMRASKVHHNSYGHGYDTGYWEGLKRALAIFQGNDDE